VVEHPRSAETERPNVAAQALTHLRTIEIFSPEKISHRAVMSRDLLISLFDLLFLAWRRWRLGGKI
jgi:hypothetical protein